MSYKQLYEHIQSAGPKVSRNVIKAKILELTGLDRLPMARTTLDTTQCRGLYLSPRNTNHPLVQQLGGHVIVTARDMNYCWDRFVSVKEMMHALDGDASATDTGEKFDKCLSDLAIPSSPEWSPQMIAELECFWRALGCLCPEDMRLKFASDLDNQLTDHLTIALILRIPQQYVPQLFKPGYTQRIQALLQQ